MLKHNFRIAPVAALFGCLALHTAAGEEREIHASCLIAGNLAGTYTEKLAYIDGVLVTTMDNRLVFNRMGSSVEMRTQTEYRESRDGRLLALHAVTGSSRQSTATDVTLDGNTLAVRTTTGGKSYDRKIEFTGEILGPVEVRHRILQRLRAPGDMFTVQMFAPELGAVVRIDETLDSRDAQSLKLRQTLSAMPGVTHVVLDASGWLLSQSSPSPFGDIETVRGDTDKPLTGVTLPTESFAATLARSNIRLPEERLIEQIKLRIDHRKPELGWPDFTANNQTVVEQTRDHVVLEIRRPQPGTGGGAADERYLKPNALLQSDDEQVRAIAAEVAGNDKDPYRVARKLQEWTAQNMKFDLGIAIAPASEVVRNRRGTCFGYAVLLASLARAAGIPSRVRMGMAYAGGIWGGHAWVDVRVGSEWIPLDAALYSPGPADAARFSVFATGLDEGAVADVGSLAKLFGNIDVRILEYTVHGKRISVPAGSAPFTISGDTYDNPWLGLKVQKPRGFRFTKTDAVWPDSTIVAMESSTGDQVSVESKSASMADVENPSQPANTAICKSGGDILLVKADGPHAADALAEVLPNLKLPVAGMRCTQANR